MFKIHDAIAMMTQIWVGKNSQCFHEVSLGPIVIPCIRHYNRSNIAVNVKLFPSEASKIGPRSKIAMSSKDALFNCSSGRA